MSCLQVGSEFRCRGPLGMAGHFSPSEEHIWVGSFMEISGHPPPFTDGSSLQLVDTRGRETWIGQCYFGLVKMLSFHGHTQLDATSGVLHRKGQSRIKYVCTGLNSSVIDGTRIRPGDSGTLPGVVKESPFPGLRCKGSKGEEKTLSQWREQTKEPSSGDQLTPEPCSGAPITREDFSADQRHR